jgi:hypothetical protein
MLGRREVACKVCNKLKPNYGFGMCSACLRLHKRRTRPSYYLNTCYGEMKRRVNTYDELRPNYYGLEICSKEEFRNKFDNDPEFMRLYKEWQDSGFKRASSPSIDRIDNTVGYILTNMRFIRHGVNSLKDKLRSCYIIDNNIRIDFNTQKDLADYLNVTPSIICVALKNGKKVKGFEIGRS